ncbi:hypothetical protein M3P21_18575 [Ruegeria sp. 2012CJ41-6]|uniref:Uncharacterized protein n=1 Tax=Ruegeria spongiae TaxID=2942209 RepID=A0ABT0Q6U6_9RHOB|nr:hypothetical protein [Ruegeria spongiae]MCL6285540.1 hypothetical protein [Ruegeria spongiae]
MESTIAQILVLVVPFVFVGFLLPKLNANWIAIPIALAAVLFVSNGLSDAFDPNSPIASALDQGAARPLGMAVPLLGVVCYIAGLLLVGLGAWLRRTFFDSKGIYTPPPPPPQRKLRHPITTEHCASIAETNWQELDANERALLIAYWRSAIASLHHYYEVSEGDAALVMTLASILSDNETEEKLGKETEALQLEIAQLDDTKRALRLALMVRMCEPMLREHPELIEPTAMLTGYQWLKDSKWERKLFPNFRPMRVASV